MVLEGHTLKHALVFNRRRALFGIAIMASFFFNIVNIGADTRMVRLLMSYVALQKDYKALKASDDNLKTQLVTSSCKPPIVVAPVAASATVETSGVEEVSTTDYNLLKNTFSNVNSH
jgi:hypothetical protein